MPASAAVALTLKSPTSLVFDVQAVRLPDSNPSAKIRSDPLDVPVTEGVTKGVNVLVGVGGVLLKFVAVGVNVAV